MSKEERIEKANHKEEKSDDIDNKLENLITTVSVADCEEAIIHVGSNGIYFSIYQIFLGKFQKMAFILLTICYTCTGAFITNSFIFLEKDPDITCYNDKTPLFNCTRPEACKAENNYTVTFHFIEDRTYSWTNDFKLTCNDNYIIGLFASLFFIGNMISTFTTSSLSDYIGRAKIIKFSMIARAAVLAGYVFTTNKYITIVFLFLIGVINPMHSTIPYILLSEYLSFNERDDYMTLMFVTESFSGIFCTIFFFIYQNWRVYLILNFFFGFVFVLFSCFLYESPRFLYSSKRYEEAKQVLYKIASFNGVRNKIITFEKEEKQKNEDEVVDEEKQKIVEDNKVEVKDKISITENKEKNEDNGYSILFKNNQLRLLIIILPLLWFLDAFAFFVINFMIKYLKGGIYLNNSIIFVSEVVSYSLSNLIMGRLGKRNTMILSFIISGAAFLAFYFADENIYVIYVLVFFSKFGASVILNVCSMFTNESFPTNVRGRATAICSFIGKLGGVIAPLLVELPIFNYMPIISGGLCLAAGLMLFPLDNRKTQTKIADNLDEMNK